MASVPFQEGIKSLGKKTSGRHIDAPLSRRGIYFSPISLHISLFFITFATSLDMFIMKQILSVVLLGSMAVMLVACGGKKKSENIIAPRIVKVQPKEPIRMQPYLDEKQVSWIGKTYYVTVGRQPSDSLPMVKDETGQKYVDNVFRMTVSRKDGSVFFSRTFTKKALSQYLDDDFNKTGVFEGLVFDKAEGDYLFFGASVGHPQSDEYIPLIFRLSRMGELVIKRDTQMDSTPEDKNNSSEQATDEDV